MVVVLVADNVEEAATAAAADRRAEAPAWSTAGRRVAEKPPEPPPPPPLARRAAARRPASGKDARQAGRGVAAGRRRRTRRTARQPGTPAAPPAPGGDAARFRDSHSTEHHRRGSAYRPPPSQADIIARDQQQPRGDQGLLSARADARQQPDARQAGGEAVDRDLRTGQARRRRRARAVPLLLEPCIKEVVQRWVFPQASEEYGTEFPFVFQGNE